MKQRITPDNREISLIELWWYVLSKWRVLIIGFLIGTIIMTGVVLVMNYYSNNSVVFMEEDELKSSLDNEQLQEVDIAVDMYNNYKDTQKSNSNSYLMMINPSMAYKFECQFYVEKDDPESVMELLKARAKGSEVNKKILALNIAGLNEADIDSVIEATYVGGVLNIVVYGMKDDVEVIGNIITEEIKNYAANILITVGKFDILLMNSSVSGANSKEIRNVQEMRKSDLKFLSNTLNEKIATLNTEQRNLYEIYINGNNSSPSTLILNSVKKLNAVHVITGAVVTVMIMVIVAVFRFIAGPKLRSVKETEQVYDVEIFGKILSDKNKKGPDKVIAIKRHQYNGLENTDAQIRYIANIIAVKCKKTGVQNVSLCCTEDGETNIKQSLVEELKKQDITCNVLNNVINDYQSVDEMVECKNAIILGQIDVTYKKNFNEELEVCDKLLVNLMGMIMLI